MKNIRWFIIFIIALVCSGFSHEETWVIGCESKLTIHGSSNINTFTCKLSSYVGNDTLRYVKDFASSKLHFTTNRMTIPIRNFNCGSKPISKDFWATLKSSEYPYLIIHFISLEKTILKNDSFVKGTVDITLAGATTRYIMYFTIDKNNKTTLLSGNQCVNFSDFKLKAPEKLNGLIRVNETLQVDFHLVLKSLNKETTLSVK